MIDCLSSHICFYPYSFIVIGHTLTHTHIYIFSLGIPFALMGVFWTHFGIWFTAQGTPCDRLTSSVCIYMNTQKSRSKHSHNYARLGALGKTRRQPPKTMAYSRSITNLVYLWVVCVTLRLCYMFSGAAGQRLARVSSSKHWMINIHLATKPHTG